MKTNHIGVLDHGFVELRNLSGPTRRPNKAFDADSIDPANTARISFDAMNSERTREQDLKLVKYLLEHRHNTPIEMVECWFEMKLPLFLARQFVRHRTACINEVSGRYVQLPNQWYIPSRVGGKPVNAKQGQSDSLGVALQDDFMESLNARCNESYNDYLYYLKQGVAPEHARLFLHVNHYTHWVWKQDLHNVLHFLSLRLDSHAQIEAQLYAQAVFNLLYRHVPEIMDIHAEMKRK